MTDLVSCSFSTIPICPFNSENFSIYLYVQNNYVWNFCGDITHVHVHTFQASVSKGMLREYCSVNDAMNASGALIHVCIHSYGILHSPQVRYVRYLLQNKKRCKCTCI